MNRLRHPVRAIREPFGTAGLIVACVALVFAFGGAAIAAGKLTGKQKKEVEKIAKKFAGKPGKPGAPGAPGAPGPAGPAGANGKDGVNGTNGVSVTSSAEPKGSSCANGGTKFLSSSPAATFACNGAPGAKGDPGDPWVVGSLPSGATETGTWSVGASTTGGGFFAPLTFAVPLEAGLPGTNVHYINAANKEVKRDGTGTLIEVDSSACQGSAADPTAQAGHLCVYTGYTESPGLAIANEEIYDPSAAAPGASKAGAVLSGAYKGSGAFGFGTFAVTAP